MKGGSGRARGGPGGGVLSTIHTSVSILMAGKILCDFVILSPHTTPCLTDCTMDCSVC